MMNHNFLLILLSLITIIGRVTNSFALPVLQDGDISEEPKDLNNWFGLYLLNEKSVLVPVELVVKRYHHTVADDPKDTNDETKWTGRSLIVNPRTPEKYGLQINSKYEDQQLILILQSKTLVAGTLSTAFPGSNSVENRNVGDFRPLGEIGMWLNNESYRLSSQYNDCRLKLIRGGVEFKGPSAKYAQQCIFSLPPADLKLPISHGWPSLIWAGDIDGDKNLDLIFDIESDSSYTRKLFLSGNIDKGEIVKESGSFGRPSGC